MIGSGCALAKADVPESLPSRHSAFAEQVDGLNARNSVIVARRDGIVAGR